MRSLDLIIEDLKSGKDITYTECRYALLVYEGLLNLDHSRLLDITHSAKPVVAAELQRIGEQSHNRIQMALSRPPDDYLGWNNDPKNPDYQKTRAIGLKIVQAAIEGRLPNQHK